MKTATCETPFQEGSPWFTLIMEAQKRVERNLEQYSNHEIALLLKIILSFKSSHLKAHSLVSKLAAKLDSSLSELQANDLLKIIEPLE